MPDQQLTARTPGRPRSCRPVLLALGLVLALAIPTYATATAGPSVTSAADPLPSAGGPEVGALTWSEDFTHDPGAAQPQAPSTATWGHELGAGGWGNGELQEYRNNRTNSWIASDGTLRVALRKRTGGSTDYTSARLVSRNRVTFEHGYVEARIKLPAGAASGVWPAFWLLPQGEGWPDAGEIDVLETVNGKAGHSTTVHGGGSSGHWQQYAWHPSTAVNDGQWHTYGVLLRPDRLTFFNDGRAIHTVTQAGLPAGAVWPFAKDGRRFYAVLNVAMGGSYPGTPDGTAPLPFTMQVDHVRHWALPTAATPPVVAPSVAPPVTGPSPSSPPRSRPKVRVVRVGKARPTRLRVTVRRAGVRANGVVEVRVKGHRVRARLTGGRAVIRLPRALRPGPHRIRATYLGSRRFARVTTVRTVVVRR